MAESLAKLCEMLRQPSAACAGQWGDEAAAVIERLQAKVKQLQAKVRKLNARCRRSHE